MATGSLPLQCIHCIVSKTVTSVYIVLSHAIQQLAKHHAASGQGNPLRW